MDDSAHFDVLLDALFASPSAALCLLDGDGHVVRATRTWLSSAGMSGESLPGASIFALDTERGAALRSASAAPQTTCTELPTRADPTGRRWTERGTVVRLASGPALLLEATPDAEHADDPLHAAVDLLPYGILVIELVPPGIVRLVATNPVHRRLLGLPDAMGATDPSYELFEADRRTPIPMSDWPGPKAIRTGQPVRERVVHARRADGSWRVLEASALPIPAAAGRRRAMVVTLDVTDRWAARVELAKSEHTYRAAFENVQDGVAIFDAHRASDGTVREFTIRTMNEAGARLLGRRVEDVVGRPLVEVAARERLRPLEEQLRTALATGEPSVEEVTLGERTLFIKTFRIEADVLERVAIDVTEHRRHALVIAQNEERLRLLVEHTPAAVAMFDREMRYVAVSRRFHQDYRLGTAELVGKSHYEVFPDLPKRWREAHQRCLAGETALATDDPFSRSDGSTDWVDWEIRPWRATDGTIGGIILFSVIVNERHAAAQRVERSRAELLDLVEKLPVGVFLTHDARIVYANPAFVGYLGRDDATQIVGRSLADLGREGKLPQAGEEWLVDKDGTTSTLECSTSRELEFGGRAAQLWVCRDLTQLRSMQAQVMQSDRLATLGTLAAGVAHEINNPLAYLSSALEALDELLAPGRPSFAPAELAEAREALSDAREGALRVRSIVRDLKTFSRPEREEQELLDLRALLDSAIAMAGNELRHRGRVVREYHAAPRVVGNGARVGQVFLNLLVNAAQSMPQGHGPESEITVRLGTDGAGNAVVDVCDRGPGMSAETQRRVFEPFFTTKRGIGTGLGLAICRDTVRKLGGDIVLDSALGRGTDVRVTLPPGQDVERTKPSSPAPSGALRPVRVLVVDDEEPVCRSLKRLLKEHDVVTETNGRTAIERVQRGERYDVILCDMMLLDMDGAEVHAEVTKVAPEQAARMAFVTGGAFTPRAAEFLEHAKVDIVQKPFTGDEVRAVVQRISARTASTAA